MNIRVDVVRSSSGPIVDSRSKSSAESAWHGASFSVSRIGYVKRALATVRQFASVRQWESNPSRQVNKTVGHEIS
jgi:hypothetical protein